MYPEIDSFQLQGAGQAGQQGQQGQQAAKTVGIPGLPAGAVAARQGGRSGPVVGYVLNGKYVSLGAQ